MPVDLTPRAPAASPKGAAQGVEGAPETEKGSDFSRLLDKQMEPEKSEAAAPEEQGEGVEESAEASATELVADDAEAPVEERFQLPEGIFSAALAEEALPEGGNELPLDGDEALPQAATLAAVQAAIGDPVEGEDGGAAAKGRARPALPAQPAPGVAQAGTPAGNEGGTGTASGGERQGGDSLLQLLKGGAGDELPRGGAEGQGATSSFQGVMSALGAPSAPASSSPVTSGTFQPQIDTPLRGEGWNEAVGSKVLWMVNGKLSNADIQLNPKHLGPMEVRISIQNDQTHVTFLSNHAPVREALEAAMPRLREMMADNGLNLGNVNVADQSPREERRPAGADGQGGTGGGDGRRAAAEAEEAGIPAGQAAAASHAGNAMLDLYA